MVWTSFIVRSTVKKKKAWPSVGRGAYSVKSLKKVFRVDVAFSRRRKVHASEAVDRQISTALLKAKLISLQFDTKLMYTSHPLLSMQKKRKSSRNCILLRLFEIVSWFFSKWTLNLQGSAPACMRQTTLFEQVVRNSEDFIGNRNLRSITTVWWTPL